MMRNITQDVLRMYDNGVAPAQIADALKVPTATVTAIILRSDRKDALEERIMSQLPSPIDADRELRKAVVALYRNQAPVKSVCRELDISRNTYWQIIAEEGVPIRSWSRSHDMARARRNAEILEMYKRHAPVKHIARMLGVNRKHVYRVLRTLNVPVHELSRTDYCYEEPEKTPLEVLTDAGMTPEEAKKISLPDADKPISESKDYFHGSVSHLPSPFPDGAEPYKKHPVHPEKEKKEDEPAEER